MQGYIVLGHGIESTAAVRPEVPAGCVLVLTEECGMLGTIPHHIYSVMSDPANTDIFADPVRHKAAVEALLKRPIRIYVTGSRYPALTYTLLSNSDDYKTVGPSGLYAIPTPTFAYHPTKRGDARHTVVASEVQRAFEGAVVPAVAPPTQSLQRLERLAALKKTQAELFAARPGVHYSLLCRAISEEDRLLELVEQAFPEVDLESQEGHDIFRAAAYWVASLTPEDLRQKKKRLAVDEIKQIIADVMARRKASGSPLGHQDLTTLLAMPSPPRAALMEEIAALDDTERADRRNGYTPLMLAALMGHTEAVAALLEKGANVNARDLEGTTPLIFACSSGNIAICEMVLVAGADPRLASVDGVTPLHTACSKETLVSLVPKLLAAGADPTAVDNDLDTPLHTASSYNLADLVPVLVEAGAPLNSQNEDGKTPLMLAAEEGANAAVDALIAAGADVNIRTPKGISALALAVAHKKDSTAVKLINAGITVTSWRKLHSLAVEKGLIHLAALVKRRASSSERLTRRKSSEKLRVTHRSSHH